MNTNTENARLSAEDIVDSVRESLIVLDDTMRVVSANRSFYRTFRVSPAQTEGRLIYELGNGQWNIPQLRHLLEIALAQRGSFEDFEVRHAFEQIGEKVMRLNARRLERGGGRPWRVLLAVEDITDTYAARQRLERSEAKYRKFVEEINSIIISFNTQGLITFVNSFGEKIFGYRRDELVGKPFVGTIIPLTDSRGHDNSHIATEIFVNPLRYYANESEGVRRDGSRVQFTWNAKAVRDADGLVSEILIDGNDVTELARMRKEAERKSATLEATIDAIPDGYIIYDTAGMVLRMNAAARDMLGYTEKDLALPYEQRLRHVAVLTATGEPIPTERFPPRRAMNGETVRNEIIQVQGRGQRHWLSVSASPISPRDHEMLGVVTQLTDITPLHRLQEQLASERNFVDAILQTSAALIAVLTVDGRFVRFNKACEQLTGYTADEVIGSSLLDLLIPPDEHDMVRRVIDRVRTDKAGFEHEHHWLTKSGGRRFVRWAYSPLTDDTGNVSHYVKAGIDITDRRLAEIALEESREDLNRAQAVAHVGSWRLDIRRNWLTWSDEVYRIFAIPPKAHMTYEKFLAAVHPDDRERVDRAWQDALQGAPYDIEHRIIADGAVKWVRQKARIELDENGATRGGFGTVQDVTERKRLDDDLKRRADELAAANTELESFSFSVSHDLRNPLNNIVALTGVLRGRAMELLDEAGRKSIDEIEANTTRMAHTMTDLLQLSRISRGELKLEQTDLSALIRRLLEELENREPQRAVKSHVQDGMRVQSDSGLIHLAIENLIGNAWKYTAERKTTVIEAGMETRPEETVFYVRDNGVGFDMRDAERIFSPFQRAHARRQFGGSGIGLSIVQRVIQRHGGRVWAESEKGKGACFFFSLPRGNE